MIDIISVVGVVFAMMLIGFLSVRLGLFTDAEMKAFGRYALNLALPAVVFHTIATRNVGELLDVGYLLAYLGGSLTAFIVGYGLSRYWFGEDGVANALTGLATSCSNSGFVSFPILLLAIPNVAPVVLTHNFLIENLVMIPLGLVLIEYASKSTQSEVNILLIIAKRLLRNLLFIALILGLFCSLLQVQLPMVIEKPISLFAQSSVAAALLFIGGSVASVPLSKLDIKVIAIVTAKLLLHPLAVIGSWLAFSSLGFVIEDKLMLAALVISAATPVMTVYPILAQRYNQEQTAALALFVMTCVSFLTLCLTLWVLETHLQVMSVSF